MSTKVNTPSIGNKRVASAEPNRTPSPRVVVETHDGRHIEIVVELAGTPAERERGLMNRVTLGDDAGMLFIFDAMERRAFWMKDTLIPIDMIFVNDEGQVVGIVASAEPLILAPRKVYSKSCYVIEVNGGWVERYAVRLGDRVRFKDIFEVAGRC